MPLSDFSISFGCDVGVLGRKLVVGQLILGLVVLQQVLVVSGCFQFRSFGLWELQTVLRRWADRSSPLDRVVTISTGS